MLRKLFLATCVCLLLASPAAEAAQIALAWDANPEPDVAGYIVEYGPSSAPFTLSANVGNVTTWTLTSAVGGITYVFRVIAYNTHGEASDASDPISTIATTPGGPTLTPDRSSLNFALRGTTLMTAAQTVRLTQAGPAGATAWAASPSAAWVRVSPAAGAGSGAFSVSIDAATAPASGGVATVTIAAEGAFNVINPIQVTLSRITTSSTVAPIGAIDSPVDHTTGVTGSIAITGWALDDVDVTRVRIYRDPVSSETPGQPVYIGDAVRVADARPDIAAAFPAYPANYRGGWGYLALTNMLPNLGNGTFRLLVYAEDGDGHVTLLGTTTITCTNATAAQPFGAIDTPAPGETVGGGIYTTFGWVLSRGPRRADIPGGGNVTVLIDGNPVGTPTGWAARSDITGLFPASEYPGVSTALAALAFDTTTLSNGLHTMAWIVTDDQGNSSGIGSRYFSVFNSSGAALATQSSSLRATYSVDAKVATAPSDPRTVEARRGFALDAPFRQFEPDESGRVVLQAEELDRVEVKVPGAVSGYLVSNSELRPLPIGSTLRDGVFTWQSGPGFVGPYDLVFLRGDRTATRQDVRIVLNPKGSNRVGPQVVVDFARDIVAGWAADLDSPSGTGIDMIHVWAYPHAGGAPVFLGQAAYGGERTDVGAFYGDRFLRSGFGLHVKDLPPGAYDVAVFAWSVARGAWLPATVARVTR